MSSNLLIASVGRGSRHAQWLGLGSVTDRNFDVVLIWYDPLDTCGMEQLQRSVVGSRVRVFVHKGFKWPNIYWFVTTHGIDAYERVWVPDDDLEIDVGGINTLFDVMQSQPNLDFVGPSFTSDSVGSSAKYYKNRPGVLLQYTNWIECGSLMFRTSMLKNDLFRKLLSLANTGYYLDYVLKHCVGNRPDRMAIVHTSIVRHPIRTSDNPSPMDAQCPRANHSLDLDRFLEGGMDQHVFDDRSVQTYKLVPQPRMVRQALDLVDRWQSLCSTYRSDTFAIGDTLRQVTQCPESPDNPNNPIPRSIDLPITMAVRGDQISALVSHASQYDITLHREGKYTWTVRQASGPPLIELSIFHHYKGTFQHYKYQSIKLTRSTLYPIREEPFGHIRIYVPQDYRPLVQSLQILKDVSVHVLPTTGKQFRSIGAKNTIQFLLDHPGHSLVRFGDGELDCMVRCDGCSQRSSRDLAHRLQRIVIDPPEKLCLAFIQTEPDFGFGGFKDFVRGRYDNVLDQMDASKHPMFSAYIGRVVIEDEKERDEYWLNIRRLFKRRKVVAVGNNRIRGYHRPRLYDQRDPSWPIRFITHTSDGQEIPGSDAYRVYDDLYQQCLTIGRQFPDALFCLEVGVAATVLAHDLCRQGLQAYDLGRTSYFHRTWLQHTKLIVSGPLK